MDPFRQGAPAFLTPSKRSTPKCGPSLTQGSAAHCSTLASKAVRSDEKLPINFGTSVPAHYSAMSLLKQAQG